MRKGPFHPEGLLNALGDFGLPVHALTAEQSATMLDSPLAHNDPFDELLLAVAQVTGHRLLTRDEKLRGHPLAYHAD